MIGPLVAFGVALTLALVSRPLAPALRLVDAPDGDLKPHAGATPVTGGIAVVGGVIVGWILADVVDPAALVMTLLLFALGTIDDIRPLPPLTRLAAVAAIAVGFAIWSDTVEGVAATIITTVLVVVLVNAVNLLDGRDGVAGSAAVVAFVGIGALASVRDLEPAASWIVAGAVAGFLVINWPPARLFLGDGGAYALGGLLVYSALVSTPTGADFWAAWVPLMGVAICMTGVFLVDLLLTVQRRLQSRARLTGGDRLHIYDRLNDAGWAPALVAASIGIAQTLIVLVVLMLDVSLAPWWAAVLSVLLLFLLAATAGFLLPSIGVTEVDSA